MRLFATLAALIFSIASIHAQAHWPTDTKSSVKFSIRNFGINTGGTFKGLEGDIQFDKANPEKTVFDISISATTINTGNDSRDNHLRKEEYFNVAQFPKISFKSAKVSSTGSGGYQVTGQLSIRGITKTIAFPFKASPDADGYLFEGSFQLNRRDFKVGGNSMVLGDNVTVTLSVFAKKK
jgi:polyisoprenoid-binding protein YceI